MRKETSAILPTALLVGVVVASLACGGKAVPRDQSNGTGQPPESSKPTPEPEPRQTSSPRAQGGNTPTPSPTATEDMCASGPLPAPIAGCKPAMLASTGDPYEDCVRRINQFRWECQCLPPLMRWREGESCANQHAAYDASTKRPHNGFGKRICNEGGSAQNECPGWGSWERANSSCLQSMWDEGPGEPFIEHGHYINMSSRQYTRVACGEGDGWFVMNFR